MDNTPVYETVDPGSNPGMLVEWGPDEIAIVKAQAFTTLEELLQQRQNSTVGSAGPL